MFSPARYFNKTSLTREITQCGFCLFLPQVFRTSCYSSLKINFCFVLLMCHARDLFANRQASTNPQRQLVTTRERVEVGLGRRGTEDWARCQISPERCWSFSIQIGEMITFLEDRIKTFLENHLKMKQSSSCHICQCFILCMFVCVEDTPRLYSVSCVCCRPICAPARLFVLLLFHYLCACLTILSVSPSVWTVPRSVTASLWVQSVCSWVHMKVNWQSYE